MTCKCYELRECRFFSPPPAGGDDGTSFLAEALFSVVPL